MLRRDFLKLFGASIIGLASPDLGAERLGVSMIGSILAKLGRGELLSPMEQKQIELWGDRTEIQGSFIAGIQTGQSDINVDEIMAKSGSFEIQPLNASYYGFNIFDASFPQDIPNDTVTVLDDAFKQNIETPNSIVRYYDKSSGKFEISPVFSKSGNRLLGVSGSFQAQVSVRAESYLHWRLKSDDSHYAYLDLARIPDAGMFVFNRCQMLSDFDVLLDSLYFQIEFWHLRGSSMGVGASVLFHRPL